jgi:hypothetical protein
VNLYDELRAVLEALDRASVDYALVGGLAVAVWGAPRATKDIDLLVRSERLAAAMAALRPCGFTLDQAGNLMTVDFMLVDRNLEPAWAGRVRLPFGERTVGVVSREALIAMKAWAARPQDLADIQSLKEGDR